MAETFDARLTILERAQLLHDATLRRQGEMLDRVEDSRRQHDAALARHEAAMVELRGIQERQERLMETLTAIAAQHEERMAKLQQTLDAIKDLLERRNGRP